jgi:uncharacterized membrane protein (UPF0127 family)
VSGPGPQGYVLNRTRQTYLATSLAVADGHWSRLRGLIGTAAGQFSDGRGLWITPCRGVHTLGMSFPIDVVYLNLARTVVHLERNLQPWRFAPIRMQATSVLELPGNTLEATGTSVGDELEIHTPSQGDREPA